MKKMSDLFYFPLASNGDYLMDNKKNAAAKFECPEQAAHVANAVNCIDELAEALEALCIAYEEREYNAIGKLALASADAALAAYRGEA